MPGKSSRSGVSFGITRTGGDLAKISRDLRRVSDGKVLRKELAKELRKSAAPMVPAVRSSIKAIPTKGTDSSGLRGRMAKATRLKVKLTGPHAQVSVLVDPRKMPDGEKGLPAHMEGSGKRWRHPVFGHDDRWVTQKPHPYFYKVVVPLGRESKRGVAKALDAVTKQIT